MNILALDPGGTTGSVNLEWDGTLPQPEMLRHYAQVPYDMMPMWLANQLDQNRPDLIIIERFFITPRTVQYTRQPEALYVIGGTIFFAELAGIPLRMQSAADAKTAWPNDRLTDWKIRGRHAKDALRHALLACQAKAVYDVFTQTQTREQP